MVPGIGDSPDPLLQFHMFFYRDAQYHRIGINLHQVPVNCPFMAQSFASLNFDGQMRVDANYAGNKQYAPNSFAHKFRPDAAETPYVVNDNIVSRKSHYWHEGKKSEYDQKKYMAQQYNVSPELAQGAYDLLKNPHFKMNEVEKLAETAQEWYKEKKFMPSTGEKMVG
ncbi:catalase-like domain-containing protein [Xylaria bambusicola]|uniref:catalase-like domain-containing protein n=1 Tax=Xylaria bambusicola TaxID=326684 RepID=UPI002007E322|nr:catalase-like domain-containing protein [Xylaria bambusicola]KAI0521466.1 catalase-like domain-containing protein [Xylaria bambusicola]